MLRTGDGEAILGSQVLPDHADGEGIVHANETHVAMTLQVAILCLEVDQRHLVLVLNHDKPVAMQLLQWRWEARRMFKLASDTS